MSDYQLGDTLYFWFTTRAFSTGIPTVLAGTPVVTGNRDDSVTQFTTGITLTVSHDSIVGKNLVTVVATGANGYVAGESYGLYLSAGTVDGVSVVGEIVGQFTLDKSAAAKDLANATDGLGAIKADTAEIGTAGAGLTDLGGMSTVMQGEVNAELLDVLTVDTFAEPGQGAPPATTSILLKLGYLYKSWRNLKDNDGSTTQLYADDGATVDQKQSTTASGGTVTKGEWTTGP